VVQSNRSIGLKSIGNCWEARRRPLRNFHHMVSESLIPTVMAFLEKMEIF
jgi:hypothetical protein